MNVIIHNVFDEREKMRAIEALATTIIDNIGPELIAAFGTHKARFFSSRESRTVAEMPKFGI